MLDKLKKQIKKIRYDEMFNPSEVVKMGVVVNTKLVPSIFTLYRLIKRGQIKAVNLGTKIVPRYFVMGNDLKRFLLGRYSYIEVKPKVGDKKGKKNKMPYTIKKGSGSRPYKIVLKTTGRVVGTSKTRAKAVASIAARSSKEHKRK